jgi:hypothetical protein
MIGPNWSLVGERDESTEDRYVLEFCRQGYDDIEIVLFV